MDPYQVHAAHCGDLETPPLPLSSLVSFSVLVVTGPLSIDFYDLTPHTTTTSPQLYYRMHDSFTCAFIYTLLPPSQPSSTLYTVKGVGVKRMGILRIA